MAKIAALIDNIPVDVRQFQRDIKKARKFLGIEMSKPNCHDTDSHCKPNSRCPKKIPQFPKARVTSGSKQVIVTLKSWGFTTTKEGTTDE